MTDDAEWPPLQPLWHLISRGKVSISTLASAIERDGIQGWDRFGRFKTFTKDSQGDDAARYSKVLDLLAAQHEFDAISDGAHRSPLEEAEDFAGSGHPLEYGWLENQLPDFSAIVAEGAGQPVEPPKRPSKRAETSEKRIIGAILKHVLPRAGYESEAALISDLLEHGYDNYDGISKRNLEKTFAEAKRSLLP